LPRLPELDGLRAVAVVSVILFHALHQRFLPGAFIGVDVFFVLSGYLITAILVAEYNRTGMISIRRFFFRRFLRLVPALVIVLCFCSAFYFAFEWDRSLALRRILASGFYLMNWLRALEIDGGGFLGHTWSLAIEAQFYLLWPGLLIFLLNHDVARPERVAFSLFLVSMACGLLLHLSGHSVERIYNGFDSRAGELLLGCTIALWRPGPSIVLAFTRFWAVPAFVLGLVICTLDWQSPLLPFGGYLVIALSSGWVLLSILHGCPANPMLRHPVIVYVGRISYGLYLWHYVFIGVIDAFELRQTSGMIVAIAASFIAAVASFEFVERRLLRQASRSVGQTAMLHSSEAVKP
jgi:peptidoglycan/LPS O-acetylase OafA/YrhL